MGGSRPLLRSANCGNSERLQEEGQKLSDGGNPEVTVSLADRRELREPLLAEQREVDRRRRRDRAERV